MPSVLITGANCGLGLEYTQHFGGDNQRMFACCRTSRKTTHLAEIATSHPNDVSLYAMEVTGIASVVTVVEVLRGEAIDLLISNAGVLGSRDQELSKTDYTIWGEILEVNVMGAARALATFSDHVTRSEHKQMVTISRIMGSSTLA